MKRLILLIVLLISITLPVQAATCRTANDREICILSIRRSAKNYWEYRATVQVDGEVRPMQVYDCRKKISIQDNKVLELFEQDGTAEAVCSFFKPPRDAFGVASGKPGSFRGVNDPIPSLDVKNSLKSP
ncbi:MAG: hypothetical protein KME18_01500 [Phormidium tanganyikae FI6-MK23]|jgi:hypothetical protein|nr:hypothetical protein [Phormidium tanganyikae FI6-MK23]